MVNKTIKILNNDKGNSTIWLILMITVFLIATSIILELSTLYIKSNKIKEALNRSVKAGTLEVIEGTNLAKGIFLINETKAQQNFKTTLADNLGLDRNTLEPLQKSLVTQKPVIKEFTVENNTPKVYRSSTLNRDFNIENPSVVAVIEFKVRGIFFEKTIITYKLSSSQLTSVYN